MKNLFLTFIAISLFSFTNPGEITTKNVNTTASKVAWKGYKVTGEHAGTVNLKSGALQFEEGNLVGGEFVIDMSSLACTDLEGEYGQKLVGHLASPDFFNVAEHGAASFKITKAVAYADNDYKVVGDLTIKGITNQIKFIANVVDGNAKAKITIDRTDFDIKYGSGSFFDGLADKTIYDEFDLEIALVTE